MKTLEAIWRKSHQKETKLRYVDWNHSIKYFKPTNFSKDGLRIEGTLCNGESISFCKNSLPWKEYHSGDEFTIKVI